jgi:hypothetical protein
VRARDTPARVPPLLCVLRRDVLLLLLLTLGAPGDDIVALRYVRDCSRREGSGGKRGEARVAGESGSYGEHRCVCARVRVCICLLLQEDEGSSDRVVRVRM